MIMPVSSSYVNKNTLPPIDSNRFINELPSIYTIIPNIPPVSSRLINSTFSILDRHVTIAECKEISPSQKNVTKRKATEIASEEELAPVKRRKCARLTKEEELKFWKLFLKETLWNMPQKEVCQCLNISSSVLSKRWKSLNEGIETKYKKLWTWPNKNCIPPIDDDSLFEKIFYQDTSQEKLQKKVDEMAAHLIKRRIGILEGTFSIEPYKFQPKLTDAKNYHATVLNEVNKLYKIFEDTNTPLLTNDFNLDKLKVCQVIRENRLWNLMQRKSNKLLGLNTSACVLSKAWNSMVPNYRWNSCQPGLEILTFLNSKSIYLLAYLDGRERQDALDELYKKCDAEIEQHLFNFERNFKANETMQIDQNAITDSDNEVVEMVVD